MGTSQRDGNSPLLQKIAIVAFVFPAVASLISILLGVAGTVLLMLPKSWWQSWLTVYQIIVTCISFLGGFLVSRWIWPRDAGQGVTTGRSDGAGTS